MEGLKTEILDDDQGELLFEESLNSEVDYFYFEDMATVYRDDEEHLLIAVNSETSRSHILAICLLSVEF